MSSDADGGRVAMIRYGYRRSRHLRVLSSPSEMAETVEDGAGTPVLRPGHEVAA